MKTADKTKTLWILIDKHGALTYLVFYFSWSHDTGVVSDRINTEKTYDREFFSPHISFPGFYLLIQTGYYLRAN